MEKTAEKLRSKHVRTLELLQKTLDENVDMKNKLQAVEKGAFQLSLGQGDGLSQRITDLELEIERMKTQHDDILKVTEKKNDMKIKELERRLDQEIQDKKFNMTSNLDVTSEVRRQLALKDESFQSVRKQFQEKIQTLDAQLKEAQSNEGMYESARQKMDDAISKSIEAKRIAEVECVRLADMVEKLKKNEWSFVSQVESLKAQKLVFESEHNTLYQTIELKERELERIKIQLNDLKQKSGSDDSTMQCELRMAKDQIEKLLKFGRAGPTPTEESLTQHVHQINRENEALRIELEHTRMELKKVMSKSGFATHIDLKKENFHLRQQIQEMQMVQKKFIGTAKKNNVVLSIGNQRG